MLPCGVGLGHLVTTGGANCAFGDTAGFLCFTAVYAALPRNPRICVCVHVLKQTRMSETAPMANVLRTCVILG